MIALIREDGTLDQIVSSLDGIDMTGLTAVGPVPAPPHEYEWQPDSESWIPRPAILTYQRMLDEAIDKIRGRYPAIGMYMAEEYRITAEQALAFQTAGYTGDVPLGVDAWARAAGMTPQSAAEDILATKAMYEAMLMVTRDARLNGKVLIAQASTPGLAKATYESILVALESNLPPPT